MFSKIIEKDSSTRKSNQNSLSMENENFILIYASRGRSLRRIFLFCLWLLLMIGCNPIHPFLNVAEHFNLIDKIYFNACVWFSLCVTPVAILVFIYFIFKKKPLCRIDVNGVSIYQMAGKIKKIPWSAISDIFIIHNSILFQSNNPKYPGLNQLFRVDPKEIGFLLPPICNEPLQDLLEKIKNFCIKNNIELSHVKK